MEDKKKKSAQGPENARHPVVVVLGHVDHGKTTLLDYIRNARVAQREAGGITQHLGTYETVWQGKKLTFLDTPGHETFSKMRERGARVADIAILVVAADDGVKPQTKEAIAAIGKAGIPFVIALNKSDKDTAEPDRVKGELSAEGVQVEGWGGTVPCVSISAKEGNNIDELLSTVMLLAELEELRWDKNKPAEGVVVESWHDTRRGHTATLLITDGTLKKGTFVLAGNSSAPVRILEDAEGSPKNEMRASSPARVAGFSSAPNVGEKFSVYETKKELMEHIRHDDKKISGGKVDAAVGVLLKADTSGSYEALDDEIKKKIPEGLAIKFFSGGAGDVSEADVKMASSAEKPVIIAFGAKVKKNVSDLAERMGVEVKSFAVIYEAADWAEKMFASLVPRKFIRDDAGSLTVLKVFGQSADGRIIGGRVKHGKVPNGSRFDILRGGVVVGSGEVKGVQRNKLVVEQLREGDEGGLLVKSSRAIQERDTLNFFHEREA